MNLKKKLAVKKIQHSRKLLKALDNLTRETRNTEERFSDELYLFFQYLGTKILKEVDLAKPLESVFYRHVNDTVNKYWVEYEKILSYYVDEGAKIGLIHYDILLEASIDRAEQFESTKSRNTVDNFLNTGLSSSDSDNLYAPNPNVSRNLERYKFEASEKTKARVTNDINGILSKGYQEGWGPKAVAEQIQQKFKDLKGYEARRIAQTELNTARNYVQYNQLQADNMEYKIWHAAHDSRTRKSHLDVDEEIVPIDAPFSNGLMYPGDKSGPISEWVNCRCSHAAYILPLGYEAPNFYPFTESDLVKVGSSLSRDYVPQILERIRVIDGAIVEEHRETNIPKPEVVPIVEEPIQHYQINGGERYSNVKIKQEVFDKVVQHKEKRAKAKIEWGNLVDLETGDLIHATDIKGGRRSVVIPRPYTQNQFGLLHNHPSPSGFSGGDMYNQMGYSKQGVCFATTPEGVWIARDTEFGQFLQEEGSYSHRASLRGEMDAKFRELSRGTYEAKYKERMLNAKSRKEANAIKKEYMNDPEYRVKYNEWLLDKYGVGKDKYNPIEIEFIPNEELQNVRF